MRPYVPTTTSIGASSHCDADFQAQQCAESIVLHMSMLSQFQLFAVPRELVGMVMATCVFMLK
jgi:hypothetical protein